jgi:hypothetical protein
MSTKTQPARMTVDKPGPGNKGQKATGVRSSIATAVAEATPGTRIRIASNLYEEGLIITQADLTLEPKEMAGEVTI